MKSKADKRLLTPENLDKLLSSLLKPPINFPVIKLSTPSVSPVIIPTIIPTIPTKNDECRCIDLENLCDKCNKKLRKEIIISTTEFMEKYSPKLPTK